MKSVIGREPAEATLESIFDGLGIVFNKLNEKGEKDETNEKLICAIMSGRLQYENEIFRLKLLKPIVLKDKEISELVIGEPDGNNLREMASVKNSNDDVGKAMAVLGSVTGIGLELVNKLKTRDLMVAVGVIGLFL